jgi:hypothetical protein
VVGMTGFVVNAPVSVPIGTNLSSTRRRRRQDRIAA